MGQKLLPSVIVLCALMAGVVIGYSVRPVEAKAAEAEYVGISCLMEGSSRYATCYGITSDGKKKELR